MMSRTILLFAVFHAYAITCQALQVGDNLCIQGYVMDKYCIDAVQMIDNGKDTLKEPFEHSVYCLVDVPICYNSDFEILTAPTTENGLYNRAYRLTENSKRFLIEFIRTVASCATCTSKYDDSSKPEFGFRAVLNVTVLELSTDGGAGPPLVMIHNQAYPEPSDTNPCQTVFGLAEGTVMSNNPNVVSEDKTSGNKSSSGAMSLRSIQSSILLNGLLMILRSFL